MNYNFLFEDDVLKPKFLSHLYLSSKLKTGLINKLENYIKTYTPSNKKQLSFSSKVAIFNRTIKNLHNTLVSDEGWDEKDFTNTVFLIAYFEVPLSANNMRTFFTNYKIGMYDYIFDEDEEINWED